MKLEHSEKNLNLHNPGIRYVKARTFYHHNLKLLEVDHPIAVAIHAANHFPAFRQRAILSEATENGLQLLGGDGAVLVHVKHRECVLKVFQYLKNKEQ